jgi:hypothetical protein
MFDLTKEKVLEWMRELEDQANKCLAHHPCSICYPCVDVLITVCNGEGGSFYHNMDRPYYVHHRKSEGTFFIQFMDKGTVVEGRLVDVEGHSRILTLNWCYRNSYHRSDGPARITTVNGEVSKVDFFWKGEPISFWDFFDRSSKSLQEDLLRRWLPFHS